MLAAFSSFDIPNEFLMRDFTGFKWFKNCKKNKQYSDLIYNKLFVHLHAPRNESRS